MQETRRQILEILKEHHQATVDDIVAYLHTTMGKAITPVTVRHHLGVLQEEGFVTEPELRHRSSPGRPQHIYMLTDKAQHIFPNNYQNLITHLLQSLQNRLQPEGVNVMIEGVAQQMAAEVNIPPELSWEERLDLITNYLNSQGYDAEWEANDKDGCILHTRNCPYHQVSKENPSLCSMDLQLVQLLTGVVPRRIARISEGDASCAYLLPRPQTVGPLDS